MEGFSIWIDGKDFLGVRQIKQHIDLTINGANAKFFARIPS